uniref:Uncharacterized protein n=1 Tax=Otolemur garnettii TaxID=30611 RepID=H0XK74_OTOGA
MAPLALARAVPFALLALVVLRASTWACLICFTTYTERLRICKMFAGMNSPELKRCEEVFTDAFQGLEDIEISEETFQLHQGPQSQRQRLKDTETGKTQGDRKRERGEGAETQIGEGRDLGAESKKWSKKWERVEIGMERLREGKMKVGRQRFREVSKEGDVPVYQGPSGKVETRPEVGGVVKVERGDRLRGGWRDILS